MLLPTLNEIPSQRSIIDRFGGYNHNAVINEGEFYDMQNLSSDNYPILSTRQKRGIYKDSVNPKAICSKGGICYIENKETVIGTHKQTLYVNGTPINELTISNGFFGNRKEKDLITMGAYVIVFPDMKYVNTADITDYGSINQMNAVRNVTYSMCKADGTAYENAVISSEMPESPNNGDLWIDTSSTPHILKQYSSNTSEWVQVPTTYIKIQADGIAEGLKQYDGVLIDGIDSTIEQLQILNNKKSVIQAIHRDEVQPENDYIVVIGMLDTVQSQNFHLLVSRQAPNLDFVFECNNRLWGCRYGTDENGNTVNEIYASKLGDFKNWNCFIGISTDSYIASVGSDGAFTGGIAYNGSPLFFKEGCFHRVYGNYPSNYQIQTVPCRGVDYGASKSLAIVNGILFYKSKTGVMAYDGSVPSEISNAFGGIHYINRDFAIFDNNAQRSGASAGALNNKYYISMKSEIDDTWVLFVYDVKLGLWYKEDSLHAEMFCEHRGELYYIEGDSIKTILGTGEEDTKPIEWYAETGVIGTSEPERKYISRLSVRLSLDVGARVMFYIQYNSSGEWEHICSITGTTLKTFTTPIRPKRCDHFKLKMVGTGDCKLYSICKTIETGSDIV